MLRMPKYAFWLAISSPVRACSAFGLQFYRIHQTETF